MSEAAAASPPAASAKPLGKPRGIGITIVLTIVTLGIYMIVWVWKSYNELKRYRGQGVGGLAGFLLVLVIVSYFLLPSYVGKLYQEDGRTPPITGWSGLWNLVPYVGGFIWIAKVQGALNDFWVSKGVQRP
jgi:Domain of unknown function (DUF4234)